ncbi:MAG: GAF domain-containing protein [Chloroflexota bacterium]
MRLPEPFKSLPSFSDPEQQRLAGLLAIILRVMLAASLALYLAVFVSTTPLAVVISASALTGLNLGALWLLRRRQVRAASILLVTGTLLVLGGLAPFSGGVGSTPFAGLILVILLSGMLLGGPAGLAAAGVVAAYGLALLAAEAAGALPASLVPFNPTSRWFSITVVYFASAGLIYLAARSLQRAADEARSSLQAQRAGLAQLESVRDSLEAQVAQRTAELQQRSAYLQAVVEVAQSTAALMDTGQLVTAAVEQVQAQFGLYYVGLFLLDPSGEWAVLQAGTGTAGQTMLARGHRIRLGSGMIGWCIANAQPRIALEARRDVVRVTNPELPDTRSEAALPLRSRGRVIGALSVQSSQVQAFGEVEIDTFQALADQLAIAIDNARLYAESRQTIEEARRAYTQASQMSWSELLQVQGGLDRLYRYGAAGAAGAPTVEPRLAQARQHARQTNQPVQVTLGGAAHLVLPIPVREAQIGAISFTKESAQPGDEPCWTADEVDLLQEIVQQMGVALDSARLYQDTRRLARREQLSGEVTARIRQTLDIQTVLRTAVEEIQRTLGLPEVLISLNPPEQPALDAAAFDGAALDAAGDLNAGGENAGPIIGDVSAGDFVAANGFEDAAAAEQPLDPYQAPAAGDNPPAPVQAGEGQP